MSYNTTVGIVSPNPLSTKQGETRCWGKGRSYLLKTSICSAQDLLDGLRRLLSSLPQDSLNNELADAESQSTQTRNLRLDGGQ